MMLAGIHKRSYHYKLITILLLTVAIAFLLLFTVLAFHSRFLSDDYQYYDFIRNQGWFKSFSYYYTHQTIRWTALLVFNSLFFLSSSFFRDHLIVFFFHLSSMVLFIYAVFMLISNICRIIFQKLPSTFIRLLFSVLFISSFYFSTIQIAESWFWVLSNLIHLLNIIFSILGFAFIIKIKKKFWDYVVIVASFLYVGGAAENYTFFLIIVFVTLFLFLGFYKKHSIGEYRKTIINGIAFAFISMLLSFIINISGPGISARFNECRILMPHSNPDKFGELWNFLSNILIEKKNLTFLLLSSLWIFAGVVIKIEGIEWKNEKFKVSFKKTLAIMLICLVFTGLFITIPLYFTFHAIGPERAMSAISLILSDIFCLLFLYAGLKLSIKSAFLIMLLLSVSAIVVLSFYIIKQSEITGDYAKCYDSRCIYLESIRHINATDTIDVKGLPDSGMLPNGDITDDPDHFINIHFAKALGLNFKVRSLDNYYKKFTNKRKEF